LDELVKSGLNIRVTQVGNNLGGHSAQNQNKTSLSAVITVAGDQGGGRHYGMISVSPDMIDLVEDDYPNTGKVPDQFKRKEKITIKPEPYKADDKHITRVTDKGNGKNTPTQLKLAGESTMSKNSMSDMAMLYEAVLEEGWMDRLRARGAEALGSFKGAGKQFKGGLQQAAGSALSKAGDWLESDKMTRGGQDYSQRGRRNEEEGGFSGHNAKIQYLQKNIDKRIQSFVNDIKDDIEKLGLDIGNIEIVSGINDALNQLKRSVSSATPPPLPPQSGATPPPLPKQQEPEIEPEEDEPENPTEYSYKKAISKKRKPQPTPDPRKGKVKKDPLAKYAAPEDEEEDEDEIKYESFSTKNSMADMAMLYESIHTPDMKLIYEQYLSEGFLRRAATKLAGGFKSNPMVDNNRMHQFAKSVSLDAGKDIAKSFGGDFKTHADFLYNSILEYLKKNTTPTHTK
jgi:hypothetical protein